jgi:D-tyrosyl-tRNA(Tyr) deacylase
MNKSILDVHGEILVVSQFTLCADLSAGRRPSFIKAKEPKEAKQLYELFVRKLNDSALTIKTGTFGAMMKVDISNDGPVTFILDSTKQ